MTERIVRAAQRDLETGPALAVYQAYGDEIGRAALEAGDLRVPGFSPDRMTWIKPSFFWMAYRCGWSTKPNQTTTLRLWIDQAAFLRLLERAELSHFSQSRHADQAAWRAALKRAPVRVQWDPERDAALRPIEGARAIQIGISGPALPIYLDAIRAIEDVTPPMRRLSCAAPEARAAAGEEIQASERPVTLSDAAKAAVEAD